MRGIANALTRSWTRLYTAGLPREFRAPRREEIESDLWEQQSQPDESSLGTAIHVLLRLALGAPADLVWRLETGAALRLGKDLNVKRDKWTMGRLVGLFIAIALLPIPPSWFKSAASAANPGMKPESNLSILLLALGAHLCAMPIALGLMTIVWEGLDISLTAVGWGAAEIVAGVAAFAGLYLARGGLAVGVLLIAFATAAMIPLAVWALPAIIVISVVLVAMAIFRWFARAPAQALAT